MNNGIASPAKMRGLSRNLRDRNDKKSEFFSGLQSAGLALQNSELIPQVAGLTINYKPITLFTHQHIHTFTNYIWG